MSKRKSIIPGFSAKRAFGVTSAKQRIARSTGIPTTKQGRRNKVRRMTSCCGLLLLSLLIVFLLCALPALAFADFDLSSLSDDELVALKSQLVTEMKSRDSFKKLTVPQGTYTVGIDIPSGDYSVYTIDYSSAAGLAVNDFEIYTVSPDAPVGKISLKDGDSVSVVFASLFFTKYQGIGF